MKRRKILCTLGGGLGAVAVRGRSGLTASSGGTPSTATDSDFQFSWSETRSSIGIADFSFQLRHAAERKQPASERLSNPVNFLEHCRRLGAGGVQISIPAGDEAYLAKLRRQAEACGLFIEASGSLPRTDSDVASFEAAVRAAKSAGAAVMRIPIGGRRYEQFDSAQGYRTFAQRADDSLARAAPVAERHRLRLAIENHKDFRVPEMLAMLKRIGSEWVGVCVDTGNSIALLEDPMEVVRAYAPLAYSVHLKDIAVCEDEEGFLLDDVPLGDGFLDLAGMIETLRRAHPEIRFCLEGVTRDPLKVPCLTEKYWATMADVSGAELARTLRLVRSRAARMPDPPVSRLPLEKQLQLEEENVKRSLAYAREKLKL